MTKTQNKMRFLLQTRKGQVIYDFQYALLEALPFQMIWHEEEAEVRYAEKTVPDDLPDAASFIPVGSVEFVSEFIRKYLPGSAEALKPLNVPEILFPFTGRRIANIMYSEQFKEFFKTLPEKDRHDPDGTPLYKKSNDTIKSEFNGPVYYSPYEYQSSDFRHFQVSELIDIQSEWRTFVFMGRILDCRNYSGNCFAYPDPAEIRRMVNAYQKEAPVAYTLDIAVTAGRRTVVVECHRFFSCGLYGFNDYVKYPKMLSQAWFEIKNLQYNK